MLGPLDVHRWLLERSVPHEMVQLRRGLASDDDLPDVLGLPSEQCAVVRVLAVDGHDSSAGTSAVAFVAALVPAGTWPSPSLLAAALSVVSLRRATSAETSAATDFAATLTSPVGLPGGIRLLVDSGLTRQSVLYAATGAPRVALGIRTADLLAASGTTPVDLAPGRLAADGSLPVPA